MRPVDRWAAGFLLIDDEVGMKWNGNRLHRARQRRTAACL